MTVRDAYILFGPIVALLFGLGLLCLALMCIAVLARARRIGDAVPEDRKLDTVFS